MLSFAVFEGLRISSTMPTHNCVYIYIHEMESCQRVLIIFPLLQGLSGMCPNIQCIDMRHVQKNSQGHHSCSTFISKSHPLHFLPPFEIHCFPSPIPHPSPVPSQLTPSPQEYLWLPTNQKWLSNLHHPDDLGRSGAHRKMMIYCNFWIHPTPFWPEVASFRSMRPTKQRWSTVCIFEYTIVLRMAFYLILS